ncbi:hypothetical protein ABFA07_004747 [Porites harrisoni]
MEQRYIPVETMMSILRTTSKDFDPENIGENPIQKTKNRRRRMS